MDQLVSNLRSSGSSAFQLSPFCFFVKAPTPTSTLSPSALLTRLIYLPALHSTMTSMMNLVQTEILPMFWMNEKPSTSRLLMSSTDSAFQLMSYSSIVSSSSNKKNVSLPITAVQSTLQQFTTHIERRPQAYRITRVTLSLLEHASTIYRF